MTPENFTYWLQGFFEIENPKVISAQQLQEIKNHLKIVKNPTVAIYPTPKTHKLVNNPELFWGPVTMDCQTYCANNIPITC